MSLTAQNSKLALLENYVATLERENRAKSKEIDIIYGQLQVLRCENGELKSCLEQRHEEKAEDKFNSYRNYSLQTSIVFEPIPEEDDNVEGNEGV